mmetsp:Transcript_35509/g.114147  ORF Transcript_35509/g.114147 Transcript_35509/m.114147 type:complete len:267 (+) Transcript_35509:369-1169(+)
MRSHTTTRLKRTAQSPVVGRAAMAAWPSLHRGLNPVPGGDGGRGRARWRWARRLARTSGRWRGRGRTVSRSGSVRLVWPVSMGQPWTSALTRGLGTPAGVRGWPSGAYPICRLRERSLRLASSGWGWAASVTSASSDAPPAARSSCRRSLSGRPSACSVARAPPDAPAGRASARQSSWKPQFRHDGASRHSCDLYPRSLRSRLRRARRPPPPPRKASTLSRTSRSRKGAGAASPYSQTPQCRATRRWSRKVARRGSVATSVSSSRA